MPPSQSFRPEVTRREFLATTAATAAASQLPDWFRQECWAQTTPAKTEPLRLALVGCGGRGRGVARDAQRFGKVVAVCDVDERQMATAVGLFPDAKTYGDFRRVMEQPDIDAVICGTVDHWHVLVSLAALRSGKDVYCEKPLTLTIDEGKLLAAEQKKTGRILQTGSQQRSDAKFRLACELVRNGRLGPVTQVEVWLPAGRKEGPFRAAPVPRELNWDFWQGPTPATDYIPERTHVTFRYWWEYSGGTMTDWGAHHNDIVLWGLGRERSGPVAISAQPGETMIPGGFTALSAYSVEYRYADGVVHHCRSTPANAWNGQVLDPQGQQHGVKFIGKDGWIWVTRGKIEASHPDLLLQPLPASAERLYASQDHMGNFVESVRTRRPPICDAEIGHRSATVCHLGVIALRSGRALKWDPDREICVDGDNRPDAEMNRWLTREPRAPWTYDSV